MTTWILVLYIYAGTFAKGDSVAVTPIYGFNSEAECVQAGKRTEPLVNGSAKELRFVCVKQGKQQ